MISRYMVLVASEQKLMMMRPYQVYAVQAIVECIHQNRGNGYIWHTTGSGKTLTSFKASTLLKDNPDIEKCLFVVDRKDLDRQTREEFNRFQEGCVEENTTLKNWFNVLFPMIMPTKVIVTTIQKLGIALNSRNNADNKSKKGAKLQGTPATVKQKACGVYFDECHRSQFGENHKAIKEFFPNAQLFGFTGTPIFETNSSYQQIEGRKPHLKPQRIFFKNGSTPIPLPMPLKTAMCCVFISTISRVKGDVKPKSGDTLSRQAVVETILKKHPRCHSK